MSKAAARAMSTLKDTSNGIVSSWSKPLQPVCITGLPTRSATTNKGQLPVRNQQTSCQPTMPIHPNVKPASELSAKVKPRSDAGFGGASTMPIADCAASASALVS
jgi:hypothetical protein